jgi:hypothetical protein
VLKWLFTLSRVFPGKGTARYAGLSSFIAERMNKPAGAMRATEIAKTGQKPKNKGVATL